MNRKQCIISTFIVYVLRAFILISAVQSQNVFIYSNAYLHLYRSVSLMIWFTQNVSL